MQTEYCFVPCGFSRDPCGMVQVGMRLISFISSVATTDTDDGTISPCRLKLTTKSRLPSGERSIVAGKLPSVVWPRTRSSFTAYFHTEPYGHPRAMET